MFIIELLGNCLAFVESYSNTHACPMLTVAQGQAKSFGSEAEAIAWAKQYLPAYKWRVIPCLS